MIVKRKIINELTLLMLDVLAGVSLTLLSVLVITTWRTQLGEISSNFRRFKLALKGVSCRSDCLHICPVDGSDEDVRCLNLDTSANRFGGG